MIYTDTTKIFNITYITDIVIQRGGAQLVLTTRIRPLAADPFLVKFHKAINRYIEILRYTECSCISGSHLDVITVLQKYSTANSF